MIFAVADACENWYDLDEGDVLRLLEDLPAKDGEPT
jgi:hypothetical protein